MTNTRSFGLLSLVVLTTGSLSLAAQGPQRNRPQPTAYLRMSGTYELDPTRSDNPQRAVDAATRSLPPERRDRVYQNLINRLEPPATIAIDRNGATVTISSSRGPRATFDADGRTRDEVGPNGRAISTRAEFIGDRLSVSTSGNRGSDFQVTFEPLNNGNGLRVTRSLDSEELGQPVTVQSYYRRIANEPRWDLYAGDSRPDSAYGAGYGAGSGYPPAPAYAPPAGDFVVPDGTRLIATLDTPLSTRTSRSGERFTMTVRGPAQFEGARIDGVVRVGMRAEIPVRAAQRAEAQAIRPAERDDRRGQLDGLANRRLEVHLVVVREARDLGLEVPVERLPGPDVEAGQELLVEGDVERQADRLKAAAAGIRERGRDLPGDEEAPVGPPDVGPAGDGVRLHEVLPERDRDVLEREVAERAGRVPQQSGDVEEERPVEGSDRHRARPRSLATTSRSSSYG